MAPTVRTTHTGSYYLRGNNCWAPKAAFPLMRRRSERREEFTNHLEWSTSRLHFNGHKKNFIKRRSNSAARYVNTCQSIGQSCRESPTNVSIDEPIAWNVGVVNGKPTNIVLTTRAGNCTTEQSAVKRNGDSGESVLERWRYPVMFVPLRPIPHVSAFLRLKDPSCLQWKQRPLFPAPLRLPPSQWNRSQSLVAVTNFVKDFIKSDSGQLFFYYIMINIVWPVL